MNCRLLRRATSVGGRVRSLHAKICSPPFGGSIRHRPGFSLLEVIIATAVLVGSATVLMSSIGASARFGSLARERIYALNAAQNLLEEFGLSLPEDNLESEVTGTIDGRQPFAYRCIASRSNSSVERRTASNSQGLLCLTVEVFESEPALKSGASQPLCRLSRWIRLGRGTSLQEPESESGGERQAEFSVQPGLSVQRVAGG